MTDEAEALAPPSGGMTEGALTKLCADLHIWADAADEGDRIAYAYANGAPSPDVISQMGADIRKAIGIIEALSGKALSASPTPASGTDEVERVLSKFVEMSRGIAADLRSAHHARADAASEWMRDEDRDQRLEFDALVASASAALAALREDGTKTETGWLIERQDRGAPEWYRLVNSAAPNNFWTKNAAEALRFARRADAEAYCADSGLDDPGFTVHITEHAWGP